MKIKNYFTLAARIFGLFLLFNGLRGLIDVLLILLIGEFDSIFVAYIFGVTLFYLLAGVYLLRGAHGLVEFAFRQKPGGTDFEIDE